jgi:hypothetical protein
MRQQLQPDHDASVGKPNKKHNAIGSLQCIVTYLLFLIARKCTHITLWRKALSRYSSVTIFAK